MNKINPLSLVGQSYEKLTVIGYNPSVKKLICKCSCGNQTLISKYNFGVTKSCGCYKQEIKYKHGGKNTRLYNIWKSIKQRCVYSSSATFKNYGGRGIKMCEEWKNNYSVFKEWALANGYDENAQRGVCTLDRINVNGNYEPSNCRWINIQKQQLNKQNNRLITFNGETKTLKEWSDELGINYGTLQQRLDVAKLSIEEAFTKPIDKSKSRKRKGA